MFTTTQKQSIAALVIAKMNDKGLSQEKAATQIGMSVAYLNHIVKGKMDMWNTISNGMWRLAAQWSDYNTGEWATRENDNLLQIFALCNEAQEDSRFMAVIGETGLGKSEGLKYYARKSARAYYVLCRKTMSRKDFLNAIAKAIGLDIEGSLNSKINAIVNFFKLNDKCVLLLDDVGKLNETCLQLIQIIYDETVGLLGLIMAGLPSFKKWFFKMAAKDKPGFRELKRRIAYWMLLNPVNKHFIVAVAGEYGITDAPAVDYVLKNSPDYGTFRELMENYQRDVAKNAKLSQREILAGIHLGTKEVED